MVSKLCKRKGDGETPGKGPVELILHHPAGPEHLGIGEVRIGKRRVSSVLGTDEDVAFVLTNNINICGIKRYNLQLLPYLLDPFLRPPERSCSLLLHVVWYIRSKLLLFYLAST